MASCSGARASPPSGEFLVGVRMAEAAIEVCDGIPSYVETHLDEFLDVGYCPWSARVVAIRR
jgi:hypothetical protein